MALHEEFLKQISGCDSVCVVFHPVPSYGSEDERVYILCVGEGNPPGEEEQIW